MADKKNIQDAEYVEDGVGFEKLLEDASRQYRVYRDLLDVIKLVRPAPLPKIEPPPTPERPLFVTSFEQLLNYGKEYKDTQSQDDQDVQDAESVEGGSDELLEDADRRYRVYREFRDVSKLVRPRPLPKREHPTPERPLFVTSFEQLLNYGKKRKDAQP